MKLAEIHVMRVPRPASAGRARFGIARRPLPAVYSSDAFGLIECIVYLAALGLVMGLAFAAFYRVDEKTRHLSRNAADIVRAVQAGERWRDDIRSATGTIRLIESDAEQQLRIPQGKAEVAYALRQNTVWRRANAQSPWRECLTEVKSSQMLLDRRPYVTSWRWDVELQSTQRVARVKPMFTFQAVPAARP